MPRKIGRLHHPVTTVARTDVATLRADATVEQSLEAIRKHGVGEQIVYFYVVDAEGILVGVVPTRRLLTASLEQQLAEIMIPNVVSIPLSATILEACETFILHKFLAIPIVDAEGRIFGTVDIGLLSQEAFNIAEREQTDALFESIGFHVSQVHDASSLQAFRFRFPWLLVTISSGMLCALLASAFEATLARSIVLAFFLTLVLQLGESVAIQSMTVTIQALRAMHPTFRWFLGAFRREFVAALMLGAACGGTVGLIVWLWQGDATAGVTIGISILLALSTACFFGLTVPALLHAMRLDPKIAAGPVTLAIADIFTLLFYFGLAAWWLK